MPHGCCLNWDRALLGVFIAGNLGIALAYFLIPAALQTFVGKKKDLPYPHMFVMFAAFILSCGLTHVLKVWTLYHPDYWVEAWIDLLTAAVSLATAFFIWPLIPKVLALRSPRELEIANSALAAARDEAIKASEAATKANELKTEFVSNISHEIRTPMTAILGLAELLVEDTEGESKENAEQILASATDLMILVNDLLDIAKLEAGKLEVVNRSFTIGKLIEEVTKCFAPLASQKRIELTTQVDTNLSETLIGDYGKIKQILQNLVQNAIKFTIEGSVEISAVLKSDSATAQCIRFDVKDTGPGISEEDQGKLFQLFVQLDGSTTREHTGSGLGLALCKRLTELMGGSVGLHSKKDAGATFWFELVLKKDNIVQEAAR